MCNSSSCRSRLNPETRLYMGSTLCLQLLLGAIAGAHGQSSLAENGGFESDMLYWTVWSGSEKIAVQNAHTGAKCVEMGPNWGGGFQLLAGVRAGCRYVVSAWGRNSDTAWAGVGLDVQDSNGVKIDSATVGFDSDTYTLQRDTITATARSSRMRLWFYKSAGTGYVRIDDISVVNIDEAPVADLVHPSGRATFHVSPTGNDGSDGLSRTTPWKTLDNVSRMVFVPGDSVLLNAAGVWTGYMNLRGSGTTDHRIVVDRYYVSAVDTARRPVINCRGLARAAVLIKDQSYRTIQNLEITNSVGTYGCLLSGILLHGNAGGPTRAGLTVRNCHVHHVSGTSAWSDFSRWISAGIQVYADGAADCRFSNVLIEGNYVHDVWGGGIFKFKWCGGDTRDTGVVVRGNVVLRSDADGIIVHGCESPLLERNTVYHAGFGKTRGIDAGYVVGLWVQGTRNAVVQYNEVAYTRKCRGDGEGYDADYGCAGTTYFQYNYGHDNEGGVMLVMPMDASTDSIVYRYNVHVNEGYWAIKDGRFRAYNNTMYNPSAAMVVATEGVTPTGASRFVNNIIQASSGTYIAKYTYSSNLYIGHANALDPAAKGGDARFAGPLAGGDGRAGADGFRLLAGSAALACGAVIPNNGGLDFWGASVSATAAPNVGAYGGLAYVPSAVPAPAPAYGLARTPVVRYDLSGRFLGRDRPRGNGRTGVHRVVLLKADHGVCPRLR